MLDRHSFAPARQTVWRIVAAALLLAVLAQPGLAPVQAAPAPYAPAVAVAPRPVAIPCTLLVTNPSDAGPGSLRQAVACASAGQTITFSNTLASATINLSGVITITVPLTIDGSGAPGVKVDGGSTSRIFSIAAIGTVTLTALVLQHGSAAELGGAVLADAAGPLVLNQVEVLTSTAAYGGGGVYATGAMTLNGGRFQGNNCTDDGCNGGALYADSTVALTGTQFLTNTSRANGGAVYAGDSTLTNGLFQGNRCTQADCYGGGYFASQTLRLTSTNFISNTSMSYGGGLAAQGAVTVTSGSFQRNLCGPAFCYGGGLAGQASLVMTGTQFISNTAQAAGGGAYADGPMLVTNTLFQGNDCLPEFCDGGGLAAGTIVTVTGSTFMSNTANTFGGGLFTFDKARVTASTFTGNTCVNGACEGAGLSSQGPGLVFNSTFNGNHANGWGGGLSGRSTLTVVNVTVSGNTADEGGGGIFAQDGTTLRLVNVTVANNTALIHGGGLYAFISATVSITNAIFANNGDLTCDGPIANGSNNLESPGTTCGTAGPTAGFTPADALLEPLALNAPGTTMTHALVADSPALDAGHAATCAGPEVNNLDQRGVIRPIDGDAVAGAVCDIGAYEASAPVFILYLPLVLR
jgi:predicted outer membrane repeat protein